MERGGRIIDKRKEIILISFNLDLACDSQLSNDTKSKELKARDYID